MNFWFSLGQDWCWVAWWSLNVIRKVRKESNYPPIPDFSTFTFRWTTCFFCVLLCRDILTYCNSFLFANWFWFGFCILLETGSELVYYLTYCNNSRLQYSILSTIEVGVHKVLVYCLCTIKFWSPSDQACWCKELCYGWKNVSGWCGKYFVKENYFLMK